MWIFYSLDLVVLSSVLLGAKVQIYCLLWLILITLSYVFLSLQESWSSPFGGDYELLQCIGDHRICKQKLSLGYICLL